MLSSLTPVGEDARGQRWAVTVTAFTVGALVGGAAIGLVAGALGAVLDLAARSALVVVAILGAAALAGDLVGPTPPSLRRQVDRTWMTTYRGWVYGLGYGVQLGTGLVTYISSWATWLMLATMVLVGDVVTAVVMGVLHGAIRAVSVWTTAGLTTPSAIRTHHQLLHRVDRGIMWACRGALVLVVVAPVLGSA